MLMRRTSSYNWGSCAARRRTVESMINHCVTSKGQRGITIYSLLAAQIIKLVNTIRYGNIMGLHEG